ncbi:protein phosphatase 1 regulatory subunit 3A isoform X1 [Anarrhichthys ocellatus]|uniref:protein phosphatase 1 regulatory subunit 3A isoform X1 n=1 Tax=Anarrhichthys ocellatus TaxID=433405 RepID=UPI0012EDA0C3|nr:protein phosphatase 1 regulatory subunit 3F isoform X1 [Anarrhichthys ocellatus]
MSFLSIPSQEGLFTTIKSDRSADASDRHLDDGDYIDDEDDDDEDDNAEDVRLIPRSSPVPRKRGHSIYDETAEYMQIHLALPAGKRVFFADTTGGDLVDVKEFVAFESDDEEESARWEEEEAKYRKPLQEPSYHVQPEFHAPTASALLQAVHLNKVEVEQMSPAEDEPLAFCGVIRVLNISFHKAVYIRSTMDHWATYFDHPAEYVQGSHDGSTDQFSFKLTFAPPYTTHGSRIEFVVRYETSDGDYWANNSSMNYVVTLLQSYEDDSAQTNNDLQQVRGILRPPKAYSMNDDFDSEDEQEKDEAEEARTSRTGLVRPTCVCPIIVQPEIDIEIAVHPSGPSVPPNQEPPSVDGTLSARTVSPGEQFPYMSSGTTLQTNSSFVLCASESVQPNKSQPLPRLHCELGNQASEVPVDSSPCALLPASTPSLQHESRPRSDSSQAGGEEIPPSEASCIHLPTTETNLWPTTGEDGSTDSPVIHPCLELPAECVASPTVTQGFEREVAVGLSELVEGLSEGSTRSAANDEGSTAELLSPVAESEAFLGEEGELTENVGQSVALQSSSAWEEKEDAPQISPDTLLFENPPNTLSEGSEIQSEHDANRNLMPSVIFLSAVVSLSVVLQEPSALFIIGLLLVLHRF